jgi:hypothetical protein
MNALDTFGLETRTTFHEISETAQAERPRRAFTLIRRVA